MSASGDTILDRIGRFLAGRLQEESSGYQPYTPSDPETLRRVLAPGDMAEVNVELANVGNIDGSASYRVVLSANSVPTASDIVLSTGMVNLPLLETVTATVQVTIPSNLRAGEYWFGAVIDPEDTVAELSEVNNVGAARRPTVVRGGPLDVLTNTLPPAYRGLEYSARLVADAA